MQIIFYPQNFSLLFLSIFQDLLGQCGHYSEKVRLDAINGLSELLSTNPNEARRHAALVISTVSERTADADPGCRAAQRDLVSKSLLPALGKEAIQPFIPVIMGHICASMTHLAEPIRADSLKLLEIIMHWRADLVVAGYVTQVLQHFGDALARPTRGRSLKAGSLGALTSIVSGLHSFLTKALPYIQQSTTSSNGGDGDAINATNETIPAAGEKAGDAHQVLCWQRCRWPPAPGSIDAITTNSSSNTNNSSTSSSTAARVVLDLLLDCWMECSPGEMSSHPEIGPARAATLILQCCNLLLTGWGTGLAGPLRGKNISSGNISGGGGGGGGNVSSTSSASVSILEKIAVHFPILEPSIPLDPPLRDQLVQLNVSAAQLLVRFLPEVMTATAALAAAAVSQGQQQRNQQGKQQYSNEPLWVLKLLDWLQGVMASGTALPAAEDDLVGGNAGGGGGGGGSRGEGVAGAAATGNETKQPNKKKKNKKQLHTDTPASDTSKHPSKLPPSGSTGGVGSKKSSAAAAVPAAVYAAALSAVEDILPLLPPPRRREMLAAAWSLWTRTQIKSSSRAKTLAFFSRLLSTPAATLYTPLPPTGEPLVLQEEAATWVAAMPRFLWELGTAAPMTTVAALQFLLDAARYAVVVNNTTGTAVESTSSPLQKVLSGLHPQLTPLFGILMPPQQQQVPQNKNNNKAIAKTAPAFTPGPLASLPESTQSLAVDVLYHLPGLPESTLNTIAYVALGGGKFPIRTTVLRCIDLAVSKAPEADSAQFWGVLLALVSGTSRSGVEKVTEGKVEGWERHQSVVQAGCRAAVSAAGGTEDAFEALGPALLDMYTEKNSKTSVGIAKVLYGLLTLCSATFIEKKEEGEEEPATASSSSSILEALPEVFLEYTRICVECAAEDPVVHVARPHAAAKTAVQVLAAKPAELLGPTLRAASTSVSSFINTNSSTTKSSVEAALLLLLEIAATSSLDSELITCRIEAEKVVKAIQSTVENKESHGLNLMSLRHGVHRLVAVMSQKLGIEF